MSEFPYRIVVRWSERDGAYIAQAPALPGAGGDGATIEEAIAQLQEAVQAILEVGEEHGDPIPTSDVAEPEFSGQTRLRMPRSLHRALALEADREGVSLNQFMVNCLAAQLQRQPLRRFSIALSGPALGAMPMPTQVLQTVFAHGVGYGLVAATGLTLQTAGTFLRGTASESGAYPSAANDTTTAIAEIGKN